jgi:hypothetical protein
MSPIRLTDDQLATINRIAAPLAPADRSHFLRDVAEALNGHELGDGIVTRVAAAMQGRYLRPPDTARDQPRPRR